MTSCLHEKCTKQQMDTNGPKRSHDFDGLQTDCFVI